MIKDELLHEVAGRILANERIAANDWRRIVVLAEVEDALCGMTWLVYFDGGNHRFITPEDPELQDLFVQLNARMSEDDHEAPWLVCLLRLDRGGEEIALNADFEYESADRWAITPDTLEQVVDQLRPSIK